MNRLRINRMIRISAMTERLVETRIGEEDEEKMSQTNFELDCWLTDTQ